MLWLALHLPALSLEAFCATLPLREAAEPGDGARAQAASAEPVALVSEHLITGCNPAAAQRGIRVGMKRVTALALATDLRLGEADPARDAAALLAVAHAAMAFTPAVSLQSGQATVLMEVQASLRLFGGLESMHRQVRQALAPLRHRVRIAAAPTALGAALLARWGRAAVAPLEAAAAASRLVLGPHATRLRELAPLLARAPLWLLGPGREHWEALQGMGLHTLSDLRDLPRAGLARRFGEELLLDLDRAFGRVPDPRLALELPTRFESRLELHQRADNAEQVLGAASVLLARLVAWAQARHGRIVAFTLAMQHEARHPQRGGAVPATELRIEMAEPALDAAHLQLLLRERLAQTRLAVPTLELRLRCRDLVAAAPPNGELFPTRGSEAIGLARLLERLRARLGDAQVLHLEPVADHRPERSSRSVPVQGGKRAGAVAGGVSGVIARESAEPTANAWPSPDLARPLEEQVLPLHRPVWLLPEPVPLPERDALPWLDGRPLQLVSGPERIEAGWWDGAPAARDYFIAMAHDGSLVWVWRSRLPAPAAGSGEGRADGADVAGRERMLDTQWMLQGRFA